MGVKLYVKETGTRRFVTWLGFTALIVLMGLAPEAFPIVLALAAAWGIFRVWGLYRLGRNVRATQARKGR